MAKSVILSAVLYRVIAAPLEAGKLKTVTCLSGASLLSAKIPCVVDLLILSSALVAVCMASQSDGFRPLWLGPRTDGTEMGSRKSVFPPPLDGECRCKKTRLRCVNCC